MSAKSSEEASPSRSFKDSTGSKRKSSIEAVGRTSADLVADQAGRLREIFPECVTEGKVDFDKLRTTLGDEVDSRPERYSFTWAGKRDAIRLLQTPSRGTLIPCSKESVDFDKTNHLFIEGDNLEVLKLLYKSYFGQVKMIYIDPPYNTGNDFIYPDNFADPLDTYLKISGQKDSEGNLLTSNPESSGRYHSAWLSMMYPRLFLARQLLREDGMIFVSIDDHEIHNLRQTMNEIFGEENFISVIVVQSNKRGQTYKEIAKTHEYVLVYSRTPETELLELEKEEDALPYKDSKGSFDLWELRNRNPKFGRHNRPNLYFPIYVAPKKIDENGNSLISLTASNEFSIKVFPKNSEGEDGCWRWSKEKIGNSELTGKTPAIVGYQRRDGAWNICQRSRKSTTKPKSLWTETEVISEQGTMELGELDLAEHFQHPKPYRLIEKCLRIATEQYDIVLDFFSGSGATAQAVLELNREDGGNRRFIMVQLPEPTDDKDFPTIAEIGKERIRRVIAKMKKSEEGKLDLKTRETPEDLGFKVFKLAASNYKPWTGVEEKEPEIYAKQMELHTDPLVEGWKSENVIWEVAIKEGYGLNSCIEPDHKTQENTLYRVTDPDKGQSFRICLDDKLKLSVLKTLNLGKDDLFICRDSALNDETAANLALQCRLKTI